MFWRCSAEACPTALPDLPRPALQPANQDPDRSTSPHHCMKTGRDWPVKPTFREQSPNLPPSTGASRAADLSREESGLEAIPLSLATYDCRRVFSLGKRPARRAPRLLPCLLAQRFLAQPCRNAARSPLQLLYAVLAGQQTLTLLPLCAFTREPRRAPVTVTAVPCWPKS
jgi:hypothetical protein